MSFLYELGINEFIQNVADFFHAPVSMDSANGVVGGYIDDLYWAATFIKIVGVSKFVMAGGHAYGYNLDMKKCI